MKRLLLLCSFILAAAVSVTAQVNPGFNLQSQDDWKLDKRAGAAGRPFIKTLKFIPDDGSDTLVFVADEAAPATQAAVAGDLVAHVTPTNLCGQAYGSSQCYDSPNRAGVMFGCFISSNEATGKLSSTEAGCDKYSKGVIDVTVSLQTWKDVASWSWLNGKLEYYEFDEDVGLLRYKIRPQESVEFPDVSTLGSQCCTCDIPERCDVQKAKDHYYGVSIVIQFAVQGSSSPTLPWAVFASVNAWFATVFVTSSINDKGKSVRALNYAAVGAHFKSDGTTLTKGSMQAFLPKSAYQKTWPSLTGDAMAKDKLKFAPSGDTKAAESVDVQVTGKGEFGTVGLLFNISGQTFSVPTYAISAEGEDIVALAVGVGVGVGGFVIILAVVSCWWCSCCCPCFKAGGSCARASADAGPDGGEPQKAQPAVPEAKAAENNV
jgi:hypothetical protein